MLSWLKDNASWVFSGFGVVIALGLWNLIQRKASAFSLFRSRSDRSLAGRWRVSGEDLRVDGYLNYSFQLHYTGHLTFSNHLGTMKATGDISAEKIPEPGEPSTDYEKSSGAGEDLTWNLNGRVFQAAGYIIISYNQVHRRYDNAFGCLFLKFQSHGARADGFFLARRSIEDAVGNIGGIGFGWVVLER